MTPIVQKGAQPLESRKTFWYTGTDAVVPGTPLVYDLAASIGSEGVGASRGNAVSKAKSGSVRLAGVAGNNTPYLTNPDDGSSATPARYIPGNTRVPGECDYVMVKANCTAGATNLTVKADGSEPTGLTAAVAPTANTTTGVITAGDPVYAVAMQTIDTSTTAALVLVMWQ